jgi:transposase
VVRRGSPARDLGGESVTSAYATRNRAGQAFRLAAQAAGRSHSGLGAFYRRMRARLGPASAIVATAHKLARIVYHMLKHRTPFRDVSPEVYTQRTRAREIAAVRKKAARLGLTLVEG